MPAVLPSASEPLVTAAPREVPPAGTSGPELRPTARATGGRRRTVPAVAAR